MFLNIKRNTFQSMLYIPALWYFDTSVIYPQWFRRFKFVIIPPRFCFAAVFVKYCYTNPSSVMENKYQPIKPSPVEDKYQPSIPSLMEDKYQPSIPSLVEDQVPANHTFPRGRPSTNQSYLPSWKISTNQSYLPSWKTSTNQAYLPSWKTKYQPIIPSLMEDQVPTYHTFPHGR